MGCLNIMERATNFHIQEQNRILSHVLIAEIMFVCDIQPIKQVTRVIILRDTEKRSDKIQYGMCRISKYNHFSICSMVDLPHRRGRRTRLTFPFISLAISSISFVLSTRKRPSCLRSWGKKGEHIALRLPWL